MRPIFGGPSREALLAAAAAAALAHHEVREIVVME
jgi:hypothetical protein